VTEATDRLDLEKLLQQWYAPAYRTAALLLSEPGRAEDAVQEAFLRLWRFRDALPDGEGLRPWIYRVVVNACYSSARGETRHSGRRASEDALEELISDEAPAEELVETLDRATSVRRAIRALPVDLRVPLVLRYYSGLSEREIATAIRRRPGTVKSRLHEARRLLALDHDLAQFAPGSPDSNENEEAR
jgi:RNA polymerase sigma-70 factor (ECF subfamily)